MWVEGKVVVDWKDAKIVPIPKKNDFRLCDNWRGISLLGVVGKRFARIVQEWLQIIVDTILPESQCGFRKGGGCVDIIYAAWQLIEKARQHDDFLFILFETWKRPMIQHLNLPCGMCWRCMACHQLCWVSSDPFIKACMQRLEWAEQPLTQLKFITASGRGVP